MFARGVPCSAGPAAATRAARHVPARRGAPECMASVVRASDPDLSNANSAVNDSRLPRNSHIAGSSYSPNNTRRNNENEYMMSKKDILITLSSG